ncbi:MAG: fructose-6-phosphate aldolase [Candidatus Desulforudis sp.]|nr:fructose-6-phosphate aldolase [Desulforudis sp.]
MELFLDTANVDEIREAAALGVLSGVTTNPSLIAREGRDFTQVVREIVEIVDGPVSAEVISTEADAMVAEAEELARIHPNVVIKIPMVPEGLKAINRLEPRGIKTNVTLVFSANQALLAALAGARYVSPFVGRLDDVGQDGMAVVAETVEIFDLHDLETKVIAASIRHPLHVIAAARAGAHIATVPYKILMQMAKHPLTDVGLKKFLDDWARLQNR